MSENVTCKAAGFVVLRRAAGVEFAGSNSITGGFVEMLLRSALGADNVARVAFASTGGLLVTPDIQALPGVVAVADLELTGDNKPYRVADVNSLQSVGVYPAVLKPASPVTFDALGLLSASGLLLAAVSVAPITVDPADPLEVSWTIALRGASSYQP